MVVTVGNGKKMFEKPRSCPEHTLLSQAKANSMTDASLESSRRMVGLLMDVGTLEKLTTHVEPLDV